VLILYGSKLILLFVFNLNKRIRRSLELTLEVLMLAFLIVNYQLSIVNFEFWVEVEKSDRLR